MAEQAVRPIGPSDMSNGPSRRRRRAEVEARILEAAERIFAEEGAPGLSMRRLADAVSLSPAAIYKYFDSKGAVIEALRDAFFAAFLIRLEEVKRGVDDPLQALCAGLRAYIGLALEKPHHYRAAFTLDAAHDEEPSHPEGHAPADGPRWRAFSHLLGQLAEVAAALDEAPADLETAARSVWASVHGLAMLMIKLPHWPETGRDALIGAHVTLVVRGVFPKSA